MFQTVNRTGCLAKGVAHGSRIGQELLQLAKRAHAEGKITEEEWHTLPTTSEGMVNLLLGEAVEKRIIEALLETYS